MVEGTLTISGVYRSADTECKWGGVTYHSPLADAEPTISFVFHQTSHAGLNVFRYNSSVLDGTVTITDFEQLQNWHLISNYMPFRSRKPCCVAMVAD